MPLRITQHERKRLKQLARGATDVRVLRRAQALLDLDAGESPELVSQRYQVARSTIYNWIKRYQTRGLSHEALCDLPRPGRPTIARQGDGQNEVRKTPDPACGHHVPLNQAGPAGAGAIPVPAQSKQGHRQE
jgi:Helix-turn-helix domain